LTEDDFEVLSNNGIIGRTFLLLTEEKLESRGVKLRLAMNIAYSVNKLKRHKSGNSLSNFILLIDANELGASGGEDMSDSPPQATTFDQEKFCEEICAMIKNIKDDLKRLIN
ncbi:2779_t:CDS:2, partial [Funneliformis geosporum]